MGTLPRVRIYVIWKDFQYYNEVKGTGLGRKRCAGLGRRQHRVGGVPDIARVAGRADTNPARPARASSCIACGAAVRFPACAVIRVPRTVCTGDWCAAAQRTAAWLFACHVRHRRVLRGIRRRLDLCGAALTRLLRHRTSPCARLCARNSAPQAPYGFASSPPLPPSLAASGDGEWWRRGGDSATGADLCNLERLSIL